MTPPQGYRKPTEEERLDLPKGALFKFLEGWLPSTRVGRRASKNAYAVPISQTAPPRRTSNTPETDSKDWSCAHRDSNQTKVAMKANYLFARSLETQRNNSRTHAEQLADTLEKLITTLRKEAPGTALNHSRFDQLGIDCNNVLNLYRAEHPKQ